MAYSNKETHLIRLQQDLEYIASRIEDLQIDYYARIEGIWQRREKAYKEAINYLFTSVNANIYSTPTPDIARLRRILRLGGNLTPEERRILENFDKKQEALREAFDIDISKLSVNPKFIYPLYLKWNVEHKYAGEVITSFTYFLNLSELLTQGKMSQELGMVDATIHLLDNIIVDIPLNKVESEVIISLAIRSGLNFQKYPPNIEKEGLELYQGFQRNMQKLKKEYEDINRQILEIEGFEVPNFEHFTNFEEI